MATIKGLRVQDLKPGDIVTISRDKPLEHPSYFLCLKRSVNNVVSHMVHLIPGYECIPLKGNENDYLSGMTFDKVSATFSYTKDIPGNDTNRNSKNCNFGDIVTYTKDGFDKNSYYLIANDSVDNEKVICLLYNDVANGPEFSYRGKMESYWNFRRADAEIVIDP